MKIFRAAVKAIRWFYRRAQGAMDYADEVGSIATQIDAIAPHLRLQEKVARHVSNIGNAFQYVEERHGQHSEFFKGLQEAWESGAQTYTMNRDQIEYVYHLKAQPMEMVKELIGMFGKKRTPTVSASLPPPIVPVEEDDDEASSAPESDAAPEARTTDPA